MSIKSLYGTAASIQAALWACGVLLLALNYALTYPIQCLMLLLTWQLAKYIVWMCTPSPASHRKYLYNTISTLPLNLHFKHKIRKIYKIRERKTSKLKLLFFTASPVSLSFNLSGDVSTLENRVRSLEQRLERTEHHVRQLRAGE